MTGVDMCVWVARKSVKQGAKMVKHRRNMIFPCFVDIFLPCFFKCLKFFFSVASIPITSDSTCVFLGKVTVWCAHPLREPTPGTL